MRSATSPISSLVVSLIMDQAGGFMIFLLQFVIPTQKLSQKYGSIRLGSKLMECLQSKQ